MTGTKETVARCIWGLRSKVPTMGSAAKENKSTTKLPRVVIATIDVSM
jgi:hypothetical protein